MPESNPFEGLSGQEILDKIEAEGIEKFEPLLGDYGVFINVDLDIFKIAQEVFKSEGNEDKVKEMDYEIVLFDFMLKDPNEGNNTRRFMPKIVWTNGECYPDVNRITDEAKQYYKLRGEQTNNHFLRLRYCDFIWEYLKEYSHAKMAIESYLFVVEEYFQAGVFLKVADCLTRSLQIAVQTNNNDLIKESVGKHLEYLEKCKESGWLYSILKSLINFKRCKEFIDFELIDPYFTIAIESSGYDVITKVSLINMRIDLFKLYSKNNLVGKAQEAIAIAYLSEADRRISNPLLESSFLDKAIKHYKSINGKYGINYNDIIDSLMLRVKQSNINSIAQMEEISTEVKVPTSDVEKYINNFRNVSIEDGLQFLSIDFPIMVSYDYARETTIESLQNTPLLALITETVMSDNNIIGEVKEGESKIESHTQRFIINNCFLVINIYIRPLFAMFINERNLDTEIFMGFISQTPLIEAYRIPIIKTGVERFFKKDYVSSIHVLIFQIEGILREILGRIGRPTAKVNRFGFTQEKMLADILKDELLVQQLGKDLCYFLESILSEPLGLNLRNKIGHALAKIEMFDVSINMILIMIILKFSTMSYKTNNP